MERIVDAASLICKPDPSSHRRGSEGSGEGSAGMRRINALAGLVALVVMAVVAPTAAAAPIVERFHDIFSDTNPTDNLCGVDGSSYDNGMDNIQVLGDGTSKDNFRFTYVFTSAATGKSVEIFIAQPLSGREVANPDGSVTFITVFKGLPLTIKLPKGRVLSRDAGNATIATTFDADGNFVSRTVSDEKGPHPLLDGDPALFCDVILPALS
jgi:hypothetical protein